MRNKIIIMLFLFFVGTRLSARISSCRALLNPIGARAAGLAGMYGAIAEGPEAVFYNPAGVTNVKGSEVSASHYNYLADTTYGNIAFAMRQGEVGQAVNLFVYNGGKIDINYIDGTSETRKAEVDFVFNYTYGSGPPDWGELMKGTQEVCSEWWKGWKWGWGINIKKIESTLIEQYMATSYAIDCGILLKKKVSDKLYPDELYAKTRTVYTKPRIDTRSIGIVVKNLLEGGVRYKDEVSNLPRTIAVDYALLKNYITRRVIYTIHASYTTPDEIFDFGTGLEVYLNDVFILRAGMKMSAGRMYRSGGFSCYIDNCSIEYALMDFDDLPGDLFHQFSIGVRIF
jgi:hypothetical protein